MLYISRHIDKEKYFMTLGLSLAACFLWGITDFMGGFKSKQLPAVTVIFISSVFSVIALSAVLAVRHEPVPPLGTFLWAFAAGVCGLLSMYFLYRGLSMGMMSIVAPIAATGVIIPVLAGIVRGDSLTVYQGVGIGLAILGTVFISSDKKTVHNRAEIKLALKYAVVAAVTSGLYLISIAKTGSHSPFWSIFALRLTYAGMLLPFVIAQRSSIRLELAHYATLAGMGILDTFAALAYVMAVGIGLLSVVSVISSLYPAVTVMLSVGLLKERLSMKQGAGVLVSFCGIVLLFI